MSEKQTYRVEGMSCASCAHSVEAILSATAGIHKAVVNYASASVTVDFDGSRISFAQMYQAVKPAGYILVEDIAATVEQDERRQSILMKKLREKVLGSIVFSIPVFVLSMFFHHLPGVAWIQLVLALPVVLWFGRNFYIIGFRRLFMGAATMDSLIALGTGSAFIFSLFNTFFAGFLLTKGFEPQVYYESAVIIITFILIGRYLEDQAKHRTSSSIRKLMDLQVKIACLIEGDTEHEVPLEQIHQGDLLRVKPGEKVPVDGILESGHSFVDESMISGESIPVEKNAGDTLIGSSMNQSGSFTMKATRIGADSVLSQIIRQVKEAQGSKAPIQKMADSIAAIFVPIVIGIAVLSFFAWFFLAHHQNLIHAFNALFAVLVIACPCALGLATPTAIIAGIGKSAEAGILIKDASSLEKACEIDTLAIDKTGTLTTGKQTVSNIYPEIEFVDRILLQVVYSMEAMSDHPVARAIVARLESEKTRKAPIEIFENISGKGVKGVYTGKSYHIGNELFMTSSGITISESFQKAASKLYREAKTLVYAAQDNQVLLLFGVTDTIKESAKVAYQQLVSQGIEVHLLSGDNAKIVAAVAAQAGIKQFRANMLPGDKANYIKQLQALGKKVAMAGDGINDSPALAQADVSFAMENGTDVAVASAQVVLLRGDLSKLATAIDFSRKTVKTIRQNLFWAFFYNIVAIPIAAGILYPIWAIQLNPMIAGAAMAFSSVTVVSNSLRLKRRLA